MGFLDFLRRSRVAPPERRAVSPTVSAYVYSPGGSTTTGFFRKQGLSFDQLATEGYAKNVIAYVAVDEVAKAIASPPWLNYETSGLERDEQTLPPVFVRPNPYQSWADLLYGAVSYYLIAGTAPIEAITPTGSYNEPPVQLYLHRPDTIVPVPGRVGLAAYGLKTPSGIIEKWRVDPITGQSNMRFIKTFHPTDPWCGLSPLTAAALGIDVHNDANLWNANLLRRGASTDLAIVAEKPMPDSSYVRLRDQLEQEASGARNVKGFTLIDGLGDKFHFEKISFSPRDMSWIEAINTSAHEVAIAVGGSTMPFLLGLPGTTTYSNQKEARQAFWDVTVIPLLQKFRDELNVWLMSRYGENYELDVDLDEVPALEPRREAKWDRLEQSTMLTLNEKREALGYDKSTAPGADIPVALLPYAMAPQASTEEEPADAPTKGTSEEKAATFAKQLVLSGIAPELAESMARVTFPATNGKGH